MCDVPLQPPPPISLAQAITDLNCSPDAFVQLSFQLAYYRLYGEVCSTYETVMVRSFLGVWLAPSLFVPKEVSLKGRGVPITLALSVCDVSLGPRLCHCVPVSRCVRCRPRCMTMDEQRPNGAAHLR